MIRDAISTLLASDPEIKLCGEAQDYPELLRKLSECKPNLVLLDLRMPGDEAIDGATVKARFHGSCLLAMSFAKGQEIIRLAESFGAYTLLDKVELATTLIPAIHECMEQSGKAQHA
jgi:chemotaxis response regulator CheB